MDYTAVGVSTETIVRGHTLYQYHTYYATIRGTYTYMYIALMHASG